MKILLTGSRGYVGSEILLELIAAGHETVCVGRQDNVPQGWPSVRFIKHDFIQPFHSLEKDFDLVIHAAGANDVMSRNPSAALELTTLTARQVTEFTCGQRHPRLLYVSTFQVYGRDEGQIDESMVCMPRNDYAITHAFAEQWIEQFGRTRGLDWVHLRLANLAGIPRLGRMERWTLVPGCFCQAAMQERRVVVRSTGRQQRDFLAVAEAARRIVSMIEEFDSYVGGAVNICAGTALTVGDVALMAAQRYRVFRGLDCELRFEPREGESQNENPSTLEVSSRLFGRASVYRMDREAATAMMVRCIDQTYNFIESRL